MSSHQTQPAANHPHQGQPLYTAGAPIAQADAAMILCHGRGASAQDILTLTAEFDPGGVAYLAPQAAGAQWYPQRFLAPVALNEPWLSSALRWVDELVMEVGAAGIPIERTVLLGFSQGACLALEYAARHPQRYGGVIGLSGALIEAGDQPRVYTGSLAGAPLFLGCSDVDFHVPLARVQRSAAIFRELGAHVTERIYPGMGHTINADEVAFISTLLAGLHL